MRQINMNSIPRNAKGKYDFANSKGTICEFEYDDLKGTFLIIDYVKEDERAYFIISYQDEEFQIPFSSFMQGGLYKLTKKKTSEFRINIGDIIHKEESDLKVLAREKRAAKSGINIKWYQVECSECKLIYWIRELLLIGNKCCSKCYKGAKEVILGINDIPTTDPWMIKFFPGGIEEAKLYSARSLKRVQFKCPICGKLTKLKLTIGNLYSYKGINCSCNGHKSLGETIMLNILEQFGIDYIDECSSNTLDWITSMKKYDFYLPKFNTIIEMNGAQHYQEVSLTLRTLEEELENDKLKKENALNNGIEHYFEIRCDKTEFQYILDNIINSGILELLNIKSEDIDTSKLLANKSHELIELIKQAVIDNPKIRRNELAKMLGMEKKQNQFRRLLESSGVDVPDYRNWVRVYKDGELIAEYPTITKFYMTDMDADYHIGCARGKRYLNTGLVYKDHYTYESSKK